MCTVHILTDNMLSGQKQLVKKRAFACLPIDCKLQLLDSVDQESLEQWCIWVSELQRKVDMGVKNKNIAECSYTRFLISSDVFQYFSV